jgi:hypothetical protein
MLMKIAISSPATVLLSRFIEMVSVLEPSGTTVSVGTNTVLNKLEIEMVVTG